MLHNLTSFQRVGTRQLILQTTQPLYHNQHLPLHTHFPYFHGFSTTKLSKRGKPTDDYFYNYRSSRQSGSGLIQSSQTINSIQSLISPNQTTTINPISITPLRVLPSTNLPFDLDDTQTIFHSFTTLELLKAYTLFQLCSSQSLTNLMISLMSNMMIGNEKVVTNNNNNYLQTITTIFTKLKTNLISNPLKWIVKHEFFPLFTGGSTISECVQMGVRFTNHGIRLVLDNSTEEAFTVKQWEKNAQNKKDLIDLAVANLNSSVAAIPLKVLCSKKFYLLLYFLFLFFHAIKQK